MGPVVGALPNAHAALPLAASALYVLLMGVLRPSGRVAHGLAALVPLVTAVSALYVRKVLEVLRARFVYTEEAKALQNS